MAKRRKKAQAVAPGSVADRIKENARKIREARLDGDAGVANAQASRLSLATLAYRDQFALAVAPALVTEFMRAGGPDDGRPWMDYDDLAESLDIVATAFARRFARQQDGR